MDEYEDYGYPNPDDEFEAMYADELDILREAEDFPEEPERKPRKSLVFQSQPQSQSSTSSIKVLQNVQIAPSLNSSFERDFTPIAGDDQRGESKGELTKSTAAVEVRAEIENVDPFAYTSSQNQMQMEEVDEFLTGEKRMYESLFGDIDDLEELTLPKPKKLKHDVKSHDEEYALIEHIIELRKLAKEKNDPSAAFARNYKNANVDRLRENLSYIAPKYSSLQVRRPDGTTVYVRFHSEEYEKEERVRITQGLSFNGVMGGKFQEVWNEAKCLLDKQSEIAEVQQIPSQNVKDESLLWVDLYKPRKYIELLSDESTNRSLLRWLKLWDKAVFNRRIKMSGKPVNSTFQKQELNTELDEHGRPHYKVALLCGPPGLGKTTLAHMVARHAGYKVVEVNASDDRSEATFKKALDNATQMSSVLDREKRPNCLVFDEIDGAPPASIEFLIKYINGIQIKGKKSKGAKPTVLKRPIICICNDVYVPALRSLRQIAFIIHFPMTSSVRLSERLREIANREGIKTNTSALIALSEKSNNDIRSCLGVLHFFKSAGKAMTLSDVIKSEVGQKDMQKGLFAVWQEIFQIERAKNKAEITLGTRWAKVLKTIQSFGDYERVANGVFENYPAMQIKDTSLVGTCEALEWFCFSDLLSKKIGMLQEYSLSTYLPFGFIVWHYVFGSYQWTKLNYPSKGAEVRAKVTKTKGLLSEVMKGMTPAIRAYSNGSAIQLDILPLLSDIISPSLRPVNLHLYSHQEKEQLKVVVNVMIDYNLDYIQERNQEGSYVFNIDPNIDEIVKFPMSKPKRFLSNSNKQLIAHEIDVEKIRRAEIGKRLGPVAQVAGASKCPPEVSPEVPNHLKKLKPRLIKPPTAAPKSFFTVTKKTVEKEDESSDISSGDIWYEFKEGHTNAVRKHIKICRWL